MRRTILTLWFLSLAACAAPIEQRNPAPLPALSKDRKQALNALAKRAYDCGSNAGIYLAGGDLTATAKDQKAEKFRACMCDQPAQAHLSAAGVLRLTVHGVDANETVGVGRSGQCGREVQPRPVRLNERQRRESVEGRREGRG